MGSFVVIIITPPGNLILDPFKQCIQVKGFAEDHSCPGTVCSATDNARGFTLLVQLVSTSPHVQFKVVCLELVVVLDLVLVPEPRNVRVHWLAGGGFDVAEECDRGSQLLHYLNVGRDVLWKLKQ